MAVDEIAVPLAQAPSTESCLTLLKGLVSKWPDDKMTTIKISPDVFEFNTKATILKEDILDFCRSERPLSIMYYIILTVYIIMNFIL